MKYVIALLAGTVTGIVLFALLLYFNPFNKAKTQSPIAVTSSDQFEVIFSATPLDSILWTDNGKSNVRPRPPLVKELTEPTIEATRLIVTMLRNSRGKSVGVGVKYQTAAEETGFLRGVYPMNSTWHIWLLQRGGLMINQQENYWALLSDVVLPAHLGSGNNWRGTWYGIVTRGPHSLGTATVSGGSGNLARMEGQAVEAISAKAYSAETGPASIDGRLIVSLTDFR